MISSATHSLYPALQSAADGYLTPSSSIPEAVKEIDLCKFFGVGFFLECFSDLDQVISKFHKSQWFHSEDRVIYSANKSHILHATNPHDPGPGHLKVPQISVIPQRRLCYFTVQQILYLTVQPIPMIPDQVTSKFHKSQWFHSEDQVISQRNKS